MITVTVTGWRQGLLKISLTQLIREYSGRGLATAKHEVDALLEGTPFSIQFDDPTIAAEFARKAEELGAITLVRPPINFTGFQYLAGQALATCPEEFFGMDANSDVTFLEPWKAVGDVAAGLENQLKRELGHGHPLYRRRLRL